MIYHLTSISVSDFYADDGTLNNHDKNIETVEIKLHGDLNNAKH